MKPGEFVFFFTFSEREIKVMNEKISMIGSKLEI